MQTLILRVLCVTILLSCGVWAQIGSLNDQAASSLTEALPAVGTYALPIVPLISTPSIALPQPALRVGAANSTGENVAGAQSSSLPQQANSPVFVPLLEGAPVSEDIYPRAVGQGSR